MRSSNHRKLHYFYRLNQLIGYKHYEEIYILCLEELAIENFCIPIQNHRKYFLHHQPQFQREKVFPCAAFYYQSAIMEALMREAVKI